MFWKRSQQEPTAEKVSVQLLREVKTQLGDADDDTVQIVAAISGLLACVAYADRDLNEAERAHLRELLGRVHGLTPTGADAVCSLLERHVTELALVNPQSYTRTLRELTDVETRIELLDLLLELATADAELSFEETQLLRRLTGALGLEQQDYNTAQSRHRDRISKR